MPDKNKELLAVVDLVVDAVKDGIEAGADGFQVTDVAKFSNLLPELIPAFAGIGLVPAEVKALTFADDEALVLHIVERVGVSNVKAVAIIQKVLALAADAYELVQVIKQPAA